MEFGEGVLVPFPGEVLCEDSDHSFDTAENGTMDHDRSSVADTKWFAFCVIVLDFAVGRLVLEIESFGELIVELDCCALMFSFQCIRDSNINLPLDTFPRT